MAMCDNSQGNPSMNLGCCRIGFMVGPVKIGPKLRKLTLKEIFCAAFPHARAEGEQSDEEDERIALAFLGMCVLFSNVVLNMLGLFVIQYLYHMDTWSDATLRLASDPAKLNRSLPRHVPKPKPKAKAKPAMKVTKRPSLKRPATAA